MRSILLLAALVGLPSSQILEAKEFTAVEVSAFDGALRGATAARLNSSGEVLCASFDYSYNARAFTWKAGMSHPVEDYSAPSGSTLTGINTAGSLCGWTPDGLVKAAFIWTSSGYTQLPTPTGFRGISAADINDAGQVAGVLGRVHTDSQVHGYFGYVRTADGVFTTFAPLDGNFGVIAISKINASGQAVGSSTVPVPDGYSGSIPAHPVRVTNGVVQDLGVLPGTINGYATWINDAGDVVGYCSGAPGERIRPFLFKDGVLTELSQMDFAGTPASGLSFYPDAIANDGTIYGSVATAAGTPQTAFICRDGVMADLNPITAKPEGAYFLSIGGVNTKGQFTASSGPGIDHAYLVSVTVPTTTNPTNGAEPKVGLNGNLKRTVSGLSATLRGAAKNSKNVSFSANGGGWKTATGTNPWTAKIRLQAGRNRILLRAQNGSKTSPVTRVVIVAKPKSR